MARCLMILGVLALIPGAALGQTTWYVDAANCPGPGTGTPNNPYCTIQFAIGSPSTVNGDSVLVRPGTYVENLNFLGKAIAVGSTQGPSATTIAAPSGLGSVVTFANGEGPGSSIQGFTITQGSGTFAFGGFLGGGIFCNGTSPTIMGNVIRENDADGSGGGICCVFSDATIRGNTIERNTGGSGAGINCALSNATIAANIIRLNVADDPEDSDGAAIVLTSSGGVVKGNFIYENSGDTGGGGGIYCDDGGSPTIDNNVFWRNRNVAGGAIYCGGATPNITNNTIVENEAFTNWGGGGISCSGDTVTILNTILWNNTSPMGPQLMIRDCPSTLSISYSVVQGGQPGVGFGPSCSTSNLTWGAGMIDQDPQFVNAPTCDFHLTDPGSPCIDAGSPAIDDVCFPPSSGGVVSDMGAYGGPCACDAALCIGFRGFCPAAPNSTGQAGVMTVIGSYVTANDNLTLIASQLPPASNIGYFIMGTGMNTFVPPGAAGPICVTPGLKRYLPPVSNTNELPGGFSRVVGTMGPVSSNITPGSTWNFQAWHRDQAAGTSNLTDAVSVTFQ